MVFCLILLIGKKSEPKIASAIFLAGKNRTSREPPRLAKNTSEKRRQALAGTIPLASPRHVLGLKEKGVSGIILYH